jgi:hypothetical protein
LFEIVDDYGFEAAAAFYRMTGSKNSARARYHSSKFGRGQSVRRAAAKKRNLKKRKFANSRSTGKFDETAASIVFAD